MKICIGTTFTRDADWMFLGANCLESIQKYCDKWGLESSYDTSNFDGFHPVWNKYFFILNKCSEYDYVLHLDADAIIKNLDFSILELINKYPEKDIFLSRDLSGICSGAILVRSSDFVKFLFSSLFKYEDLRCNAPGEQDALIRYFRDNFLKCAQKIKFVNPSIFHLTTWGDTDLNNYYWKNPDIVPFIFHSLGGTIFSKQQILNFPTIAGDRNSFKNFFNKPVVGAEIGTYIGEYAAHCLSQIDGALFLIDDWKQSVNRKDITNREQFTRNREFDFVSTLFKDKPNIKIIRKSSIDAAKGFSDNTFDYVYIDAYHQYDAVRNDLQAWWPKVKKGGLLCGHDYINNEDATTLIETKSAVDDFVYENFPLKGFVSSELSFKSWYIYK